jgi:hypothetical protein
MSAADFAGLLAHMQATTPSGRRSREKKEKDMALAREAIRLSKMGENALRATKDQAEKPEADLAALYEDTVKARDALKLFISRLSMNSRLCVLKPLFEAAWEDWDDLAENLAMIATPERRALLDGLIEAAEASKDKFTDWRDSDLFQ